MSFKIFTTIRQQNRLLTHGTGKKGLDQFTLDHENYFSTNINIDHTPHILRPEVKKARTPYLSPLLDTHIYLSLTEVLVLGKITF